MYLVFWNHVEVSFMLSFPTSSSQILVGFRQEAGEENWMTCIKQFPEALRDKLAACYPIL